MWEQEVLGNFEYFIGYTLNQKLLVKLKRLLQKKSKYDENKMVLAIESFRTWIEFIPLTPGVHFKVIHT